MAVLVKSMTGGNSMLFADVDTRIYKKLENMNIILLQQAYTMNRLENMIFVLVERRLRPSKSYSVTK